MRLLFFILALSASKCLAGVGSIVGTPYSAFEPETLTYISNIVAAGGTITYADASAVDRFAKSAVSHGYWSNLLEVGPMAGDQLAASLVKLRVYTGLSSSLTNHGFVSGDYTASGGISGGNNKWLDTGFNPLAYGSKNIGSGFFVNDEFIPENAETMFGTSGQINPLINMNVTAINGPPNFTFYNGGGGSFINFLADDVSYAYGIGKCFTYGVRRSNTSSKTFLSGHAGNTYTGSETNAPQANTLSLFGGRTSGGAQDFFLHKGSFYSIDDSTLTDNQCALLAADVIQLQRELGRVVAASRPQLATFLIGQSLAIGTSGAPTLSTNQTYQNRAPTSTFSSAVTNLPIYNLTPLREPAVETPASGFANLVAATWRVSHASDSSQDLAIFNDATGGAGYAQLKKGGTLFNYTYSLQNLTNLNSIIADYGTNLVVPGIICVHGETDWNNTNYSANIAQWQSDYQGDVQAITRQSVAVPIFHTQISSWTSTNTASPSGSATAVSPYQVLSRYELDPTKTILVAPKYIFTYATDGTHLINTSYRWLGEYYAKAWYKVVALGGTWSPLYPTSISRSGPNIDLTFSSAVGNLTLDTSLVSDPGNNGFEYTDDSSPPAISSVTVTGSNTVRVTLASTPTGANKRIRYAYTGTPGNSGGPTTGPRGNLRDSDTTFTSLYGNTLYNWCVHFDKDCP